MSAETWNGLLNGLNAYAHAEQSDLMIRGVHWLRTKLGMAAPPKPERKIDGRAYLAGSLEPPA